MVEIANVCSAKQKKNHNINDAYLHWEESMAMANIL
jgi:hypothetical protein